MATPTRSSTMKPTVQSSGRRIFADVCSNWEPLKWKPAVPSAAGRSQVSAAPERLPLAAHVHSCVHGSGSRLIKLPPKTESWVLRVCALLGGDLSQNG